MVIDGAVAAAVELPSAAEDYHALVVVGAVVEEPTSATGDCHALVVVGAVVT